MGKISNINWNVNLKDSGAIVARTKIGFMMVYLVYTNEGIYYQLSPLVENGGVLGGDAYLLVRQLPRMDFESALRKVEKRIHNSDCYINFRDREDDVIFWNGQDNVITKTVISDTKMIFDITYKGDRRVVDVEKTLVLSSDTPRIEYRVSVDSGERTTAKVHYYVK